jgi:hypothetical protein
MGCALPRFVSIQSLTSLVQLDGWGGRQLPGFFHKYPCQEPMSKRIQNAVVALIPLLFVSTMEASEAGRAVFPTSRFDFGKVVRGTLVEHKFVLKNEGSAALKIKKISMTPPLIVKQMPGEVAPGAEGVLLFQIDTSSLQGPFEGQALVSLDDPGNPEAVLTIEGKVVSRIEISPSPAFFVAARRGESKQASLEIINHEPEPLILESIEHSTERFTTNLETIEKGQRYRLHLSMKPDGPGGKKTEPIVLKTSSKTSPVLRVQANTYLRERVYSFPDVVDLGNLPMTAIQRHPDLLQKVAQTLMAYQSGGSDFQAKLATDLPILDLKSVPGPKGDRHQITISLIRDKIQVGPIKGSIFIETNDPEFSRLTVPVVGFILDR